MPMNWTGSTGWFGQRNPGNSRFCANMVHKCVISRAGIRPDDSKGPLVHEKPVKNRAPAQNLHQFT